MCSAAGSAAGSHVWEKRGAGLLWLARGSVQLDPVGVRVEVRERVSKPTERAAGPRAVHQDCETWAGGSRPTRHRWYVEIPRVPRSGADVGRVLRVVEMPKRLGRRQVATYRADPWRGAGEDLDHRGVVNQVGSKRITNDSFVKRRVERLRRRCGSAYHGYRCCDCCDHEQQGGTASIGWVHAHSTL